MHLRGLARHLESCPAHPAVRRVRCAEAERSFLQAGGAVHGAPCVERFGRPSWKQDHPDSYAQAWEATLSELITFEPTELSDFPRRVVVGLPADWEEMRALAQQACPWCQGQATPAHLLACAAHPATLRAEALEQELARVRGPNPTPLAALRASADRHALGLAGLVDTCTQSWNAMRDGERGQSLSTPCSEALMEKARAKARALAAGPLKLSSVTATSLGCVRTSEAG